MKTIILIILGLGLCACMTVEHTPVPQQIKDDHDWPTLTKKEKERLQDKYGGVKAVGTGQYDKLADVTMHIDTTAKFTVIGEAVSEGFGHMSGIAKEVWSGAN